MRTYRALRAIARRVADLWERLTFSVVPRRPPVDPIEEVKRVFDPNVRCT